GGSTLPALQSGIRCRIPPPAADGARPRPVEHDLRGVGEVFKVRILHQGSESAILYARIELVVAEPARNVEVRGTYACPRAICHRRLGVHHGTLPLEDAHARLQERPIAGPGQRAKEGDVTATRNQQANV